MRRIGLIGLGNIGRFYAQRLLETGYPLTVLDIDAARTQAVLDLGANAAEDPGDVARKSEIIVLSLPGSHAVEQVMDGEDGILAHVRPGHLIVDTGTSRPATDIRYAQLCAEKGAALLDAPLTYRRPGQIMMVGGSREDFERAEAVLTCLSYKLRHVGEVGEGQILKLINQAVLAGRLAIYAEAARLGHLGILLPLLQHHLQLLQDQPGQ